MFRPLRPGRHGARPDSGAFCRNRWSAHLSAAAIRPSRNQRAETMNLKKSIAGALTALAVATMAVSPAAAGGSKSYCAQKARNVANTRALGSTAVGAGVGCIIGAIVSKKCGVGAAVGGVSGFAIGSVQWKKVYNQVYWKCRNS
jgi:hypothetical protein